MHWHCLDYYIRKDHGNLFLYSPAIYKYRLPTLTIVFEDLKKISENTSLSPYLIDKEKGEEIGEHNFRNDIAIKQFTNEIKSSNISVLEQELWYKIIFYLNYHSKEFDESYTCKFHKFCNILLIDDKAEFWNDAISSLYTDAVKVTLIRDLDEFTTIITSYKTYLKEDDIKSINKKNDLKEKNISVASFLKEISLKHTLILLDLYFDKNDSNKEMNQTKGFEILQNLANSNIKIPVIIFSASLKNLDSLYDIYDFIIGRFVKSFSSPKTFVGLVNKSIDLNAIAIIIHKLSLLEKYEGDFLVKIKSTYLALDSDKKSILLLHINSIISKLLFIERLYLLDYGQYEKTIDKNLFEIIVLMSTIISSYDDEYKNKEQTGIKSEIKELRNTITHLTDITVSENGTINSKIPSRNKATFNAYVKKQFKDKIDDINKYSNELMKGLLFGN